MIGSTVCELFGICRLSAILPPAKRSAAPLRGRDIGSITVEKISRSAAASFNSGRNGALLSFVENSSNNPR